MVSDDVVKVDVNKVEIWVDSTFVVSIGYSVEIRWGAVDSAVIWVDSSFVVSIGNFVVLVLVNLYVDVDDKGILEVRELDTSKIEVRISET